MFNLTTAEREFPLDETIDIPRRIAEYKRGDRVLFVAITKAAFITTGPVGAEFMYLFEEGVSLGAALRTVCEKYGHDKEEQIRGILGDLLIQIETRQFYQHAKTTEGVYGHTMLARLTNRCNLRCTHCLVSSAPDWPTDNELSFSQWCDVLDGYAQFVKQRSMPISRVTFTGGEALTRSDALDIIRHSKSLGLNTELYSNGVLIANNSAIATAIAQAGVDEVQISLDGATAEVHDAVRGRGMFKKTTRALTMLRDAGVRVRMAVVVMPQNYDDLLTNLVPLIRGLGDGFPVRLSLCGV